MVQGNTAYGVMKHKIGTTNADACYMAISYVTVWARDFLHAGCACPILP